MKSTRLKNNLSGLSMTKSSIQPASSIKLDRLSRYLQPIKKGRVQIHRFTRNLKLHNIIVMKLDKYAVYIYCDDTWFFINKIYMWLCIYAVMKLDMYACLFPATSKIWKWHCTGGNRHVFKKRRETLISASWKQTTGTDSTPISASSHLEPALIVIFSAGSIPGTDSH